MKLLTPIKTKKEVKFGKSLQTLTIAATLFAIAALIAIPTVAQFIPVEFRTGFPVVATIGIWAIVVLGGLFYSWLLILTLQTLGSKGEFVHGLATIAYSLLPISFGTLLAALLTYIPYLGALLSFIVIATFGVIGYALVYRLITLLFETDIITAFIAVGILTGVTILAIYTTGISFGLSLGKLLPQTFS